MRKTEEKKEEIDRLRAEEQELRDIEYQKWKEYTLRNRNKSVEDKTELSVKNAKRLLDSIGETITNEMITYITEDSEKFFLENPNKTYYDQRWFVKYLKKHKKQMNIMQGAFASSLIKAISAGNQVK